MTLPVSEVFQTIQGEATHAGRPAVFVRLQGCPVGCPWCDTKYTWHIAPEAEINPGELMTKDGADERWAGFSVEALVGVIAEFRAKLVVLTGGEPAMHDLTDLTLALIKSGRDVQIETSGTFPIRCHPLTWVTVSPKLDMPGGYPVLDDALARANEIKMPIGKPADVQKLFGLIDRGVIRDNTPIWLQPLSLSRKATDLCAAAATANGFRVSVQIHALAGWR